MECKTRCKNLQLNYIKVISWNFKFNGTLALFLLRNEELAKTDYLQKKENQTGIQSVTLTLDAKSFCNISGK